MEPEKFDKKKFDDLFKNLNFSFSTVPVYSFNNRSKQETIEEMTARLDEVDETVDAMTSYPQAKKMLDKLYGKM
jgi:hypothetical protein